MNVPSPLNPAPDRAATIGSREDDRRMLMPRMGDLAATDVYSAFDVPLEQTYDRRLDETWPGRLAQDAIGAVLAPGRALQSTEPITTEQMIKPAVDLAGW